MNFTNSKGYIEKDRGSIFPESWIWFQTNHFTNPDTSLFGSFATLSSIAGITLNGHIIGFLHKGRLYRFALYTGAVRNFFKIE